MENEWKWVPVSQVAEPILGGTPMRSEPGYWGGNIKWAAAKDIVAAQGRRVYQTEETITPLGVAQSAAKILPKGTVVITARGTVGAVAQLGDDMAFNQTCYGLVAKPEIDQDFLYYAIKATLRTAYTLSYGTVFDTITKKTFEQWRIPLPLLVEQRAIAHILGTLDDKIELNQRINETLEAIARAIFKSWFIDFDPVIDNALKAGKPIPDELEEKAARRREVLARARAEGRPAGLPGHLARLFPDEFEESELGWIPKGWGINTLEDLCEVTIGGDWGKDEPFPSAVEVVCLRGVDLENLRQFGCADAPRRWVKESSVVKRCLDERDVLVAASGIGPVGRSLWAAPELLNVFDLPVVYSNFCKRFRCASPSTAVYLDRLLYMMRETGEIWEYVDGTSVPNLNIKGLLSGKVILLPSQQILERFYEFLRPVSSRLYSAETRTLAAIRDALLPKLISGEIRVREAERFAERAMD